MGGWKRKSLTLFSSVLCGSVTLWFLLFFSPLARADDEPVKLAKVEVRGNRRIDTTDILNVLKARAGEKYSAAVVREDIRAIWAMRDFDDVRAELDEVPAGSGNYALAYIVREKPWVRKILLLGNDELDAEDIQKVVDLRPFERLNFDKIVRNVEKVREAYLKKGFFLAEVRHEIRKLPEGDVDVILRIDENTNVIVKEVLFLGNKAIPAAELKESMATREGDHLSFLSSAGTFDEEEFGRDHARVQGYYHDRGYVNVKVGQPLVTLSPDKKFLSITIHVDEGEQHFVGDLDVSGDMVKPREEIKKLIQAKPGEIFSKTKMLLDMSRVSNVYKDDGYAFVTVTPVTTAGKKPKHVNVTFDVQKGMRVTVERITVSGNTKTRDKVIRRHIKLAEGEIYNAAKIAQSKRRVLALGFFDDQHGGIEERDGAIVREGIVVTQKKGSREDRVILNFEVKEKPSGTFQIGAGFSSVESFIATAQIAEHNLFGRGQDLSLQAQLSALRQLFRLSFLEPHIADTDIIMSFSVFNMQLDYFNFLRASTGGTLLFGYNLTDSLQVALSYKLEQVNASLGGSASRSSTNILLANLFQSGRTSSVKGSIAYDTRNNRIFPSRGTLVGGTVEHAAEYTGSTNLFTRLSGYGRAYFPFLDNWIFKLNLELGFITSPNPQGVPIFERYFTGGINSVRGYEPRSLGPRLKVPDLNDPAFLRADFNIGGNKEMVFNAEIEIPIVAKIGIKGVVFFDAGNAFDDAEEINPLNLRMSWGFGFRWFSPIGPLRFEWGIPINRRVGEQPIVFEFTIGNTF